MHKFSLRDLISFPTMGPPEKVINLYILLIVVWDYVHFYIICDICLNGCMCFIDDDRFLRVVYNGAFEFRNCS